MKIITIQLTLNENNEIVSTTSTGPTPSGGKKITQPKKRDDSCSNLISRRDVAKMLDLTPWTITRWVKCKVLPEYDVYVGRGLEAFWYRTTILPHIQKMTNYKTIKPSTNSILYYLTNVK